MPTRRAFIAGAAVTVAAASMTSLSHAQSGLLVRRDVMDLPETDRFFTDYAKAVKEMHARSDRASWPAQAMIHADSCEHGNVQFFHWHRQYLRAFERICAALSGNPDFALPYWNWSKNSGKIPAPFFDIPELNVTHWNDPGNYFGAKWGPVNSIATRFLDKTFGLMDVDGGPFHINALNNFLQLGDIGDFLDAIENGPHSGAHVIVGAHVDEVWGHMHDGLSPLDPIFWLHHCMVDRMWALWQAREGNVTPDPAATYNGHFVDSNGTPTNANSTEAMTTSGLGYRYDDLPIPEDMAPPPLSNRILGGDTVAILGGIATVLRSRERITFGSSTEAQRVMVGTPTSTTLAVADLGEHVKTLAGLRQQGLELTSNRIVAILSDVVDAEAEGIYVDVFVNCPYLSPLLSYTDPHFAGTFAFFGKPSAHGSHESREGGRRLVVDLTEPMVKLAAQGRDFQSGLTLQFVPRVLRQAADGKQFAVGRIEIVAA